VSSVSVAYQLSAQQNKKPGLQKPGRVFPRAALAVFIWDIKPGARKLVLTCSIKSAL
jgi:hypothetical protein